MPKNDLKTPRNEILKVSKNAEKSHFYTEKCHFEVIFSPFQNLFFSLHNPTHYRSKSKKRRLTKNPGHANAFHDRVNCTRKSLCEGHLF